VDNFSTRIGEGFQQEAAQAYEQTNMKDAEHQVHIFLNIVEKSIELTTSGRCASSMRNRSHCSDTHGN
jgi:hypothetical protein